MERTCSLTLMICAAPGTQAMNSESNTDSAVEGIRGKRPLGESTLVLRFVNTMMFRRTLGHGINPESKAEEPSGNSHPREGVETLRKSKEA
jgi:hypothetical protein